jgi:hypothetical protein
MDLDMLFGRTNRRSSIPAKLELTISIDSMQESEEIIMVNEVLYY